MLSGLKFAVISAAIGTSLTSFAATDTTTTPPNLMPCEQVLKFNSTDFVNQYTKVHGDNALERINAIYKYSDCYSQQLDNLQAKMNESGHHPLMGANANFRDFETALNNFTATVLGFCGPDAPLKRVTAAYATLYQKQFRNLFYQQYLPKGKSPSNDSNAIMAAKAKLEEVIKKLPDRQKEPAIKSFTAYYEAAVTGLNFPAQPVYEYAIMLLQSPSDKPYSSPPF